MVHVPASLSILGKLERRSFKTDKEANKFAAKLRTQYHKGIRGAVADPAAALATQTAQDILNESGLEVTLVEAVRAYCEARQTLAATGASLNEVCDKWAERLKSSRSQLTFVEAKDEFVRKMEGDWSERYLSNVQQTMRSLPEWFNQMRLGEIDDEVAERAIREKASGGTVKLRKSHVDSVRAGKGKQKRRQKKVVIPSGDQCDKLLAACKTKEEKWAIALLLFAGIRPDKEHGEITRLDWSAVKGKSIHISPEVSKNDYERIIPIRPRLARLIQGHPKSGPVRPIGWQARWPELRKAAGFDATYQDATRHAFASHHLVAYGEAKTQAAMGHTEGSRVLFKNYRAAVTEQQAKAYFK